MRKREEIGATQTHATGALQEISAYLAAHGIEATDEEARILLMESLGIEEASRLYTQPLTFTERARALLRGYLDKRTQGIPLQYVVGKAHFMDFTLGVEEGVFIPRPETEVVVEKFMHFFKKAPCAQAPLIADIGTGSGNIAISLTTYIKDCRIIALDVSKKSLAVAHANAVRYHVRDSIFFLQQDAFALSPSFYEQCEGIIANLPYVPRAHALQREVAHEPARAIFAEEDGAHYFKKLFSFYINMIITLQQ